MDWCGEWAAAYPRTAIVLSRKDWELIRAVANSRRLQGRSGRLATVVAELIEAARNELKVDAEEFYKRYPVFRRDGDHVP